jgi:hypothetical protein
LETLAIQSISHEKFQNLVAVADCKSIENRHVPVVVVEVVVEEVVQLTTASLPGGALHAHRSCSEGQ